MRHHYSPLVDSDLDDIWYYIASRSGSMDDEDLRHGLRTFPVGGSVIFYRIELEDVVIRRAAQQPQHLQPCSGIESRRNLINLRR